MSYQNPLSSTLSSLSVSFGGLYTLGSYVRRIFLRAVASRDIFQPSLLSHTLHQNCGEYVRQFYHIFIHGFYFSLHLSAVGMKSFFEAKTFFEYVFFFIVAPTFEIKNITQDLRNHYVTVIITLDYSIYELDSMLTSNDFCSK